jgi:hypothetical protein
MAAVNARDNAYSNALQAARNALNNLTPLVATMEGDPAEDVPAKAAANFGRALMALEDRNSTNQYLNIDSDFDGLPDWWELQYFGNLYSTAPAIPTMTASATSMNTSSALIRPVPSPRTARL